MCVPVCAYTYVHEYRVRVCECLCSYKHLRVLMCGCACEYTCVHMWKMFRWSFVCEWVVQRPVAYVCTYVHECVRATVSLCACVSTGATLCSRVHTCVLCTWFMCACTHFVCFTHVCPCVSACLVFSHTCVHILVRTRAYVWGMGTHTCVCVSTCTQAWLRVCKCLVNVCVFTCMRTCVLVFVHACVCSHVLWERQLCIEQMWTLVLRLVAESEPGFTTPSPWGLHELLSPAEPQFPHL